jgi:hypothetical protein
MSNRHNPGKRGSTYSEEAYARGKMLDHSGWDGLLPRNITRKQSSRAQQLARRRHRRC